MDEGELIGKRAIVNFHGRKLLGYGELLILSSFVIKMLSALLTKSQFSLLYDRFCTMDCRLLFHHCDALH